MRNCAFCPAICRKAGEPPGAIFAVLYRSRRHRMATRHRTDFNISYESSMNSNGFRLCDHRVCISPRAHPTPKFAFWCSKNSGFVVFTMSPSIRLHRAADLLADPPGYPGPPGCGEVGGFAPKKAIPCPAITRTFAQIELPTN